VSDRSKQLWKVLSQKHRLFLIAGPCVIESEALCLTIADSLRRTCARLGINFIFKASYDKANRTSGDSFRGPGLERGLTTLEKIRDQIGIPVLTDVHTIAEATTAGEVADVIQIPAFLCRQTDLIEAAVATSAIVNIKKGQFLSPRDMGHVLNKAKAAGGKRLMVTERGTTFGYNNLVADMRAMPILREFGFPVVFDATHSVQLPGGAGSRSAGQGEYAPVLARAAMAAGANGVFIETHPNPAKALSDGPNMIPLEAMAKTLASLAKIHRIVNS
jgi:2-dehydro-3-deoxyphosphooctonate aldolase (KDO 8-P synthase)